MNEEFLSYLKAIEMSDVLINKVESIYNFYKETCPEVISGIFVTDSIDKEGKRIYESVWFFSESFMMEAKVFASKDDFDLTPYKNKVTYWNINKLKYDWKKATEKSRMNLEFKLDRGIVGDLRAAKNNCDFLREFTIKYIFSNLLR